MLASRSAPSPILEVRSVAMTWPVWLAARRARRPARPAVAPTLPSSRGSSELGHTPLWSVWPIQRDDLPPLGRVERNTCAQDDRVCTHTHTQQEFVISLFVPIACHHCLSPLPGTIAYHHCLSPLFVPIACHHCLSPLPITTVCPHCLSPLPITIAYHHCLSPLPNIDLDGQTLMVQH